LKLFKSIIKTGIYPNDWKCAHITAIYKRKGGKKDRDNYRPLSILPPIAQIFEVLTK
jgi:hypothetical protein